MPSPLPGEKRSIEWNRGSGEVWALSGALHGLTLELPDGRTVQPLAEAPWQRDAQTAGDEDIPAHLRFLGGEWPCVPFGASDADPVTHGFGTDSCWRFEAADDGAALAIDYPEDRPVRGLRRTVRGIPGEARVECRLEADIRRDCTLPVGLHPILAVGEAMRIEGTFTHGETFPVEFERGVSRLAVGARFEDTQALPLADGGTIPFGALTGETTEEAFQLFGVDGVLKIVHPEAGYAVRLEWDPNDYPTCLFWISTGGRTGKPWSGRFRGIGVEPLNARFADRDGKGAIEGGRSFKAGERWSTAYSIAVEPLA